MNSLGIYFGPKFISVVETKGRKLVSSALIPQSTMPEGELEESSSAEAKSARLINLLKEELKKNNIQAKEATLSLSGKDLIIRILEMPVMSRDELQSAINFEVKKYIPFKVEDLISDSQITLDKDSHSNLVLFIGIKKEILDKYISILDQLNIKIKAIEYSAYSILRCLKLTNSSDRGVIGVLAVDIQGKDEVNFTVLENGFPLFSRDIALVSEAGDLGDFEEKSIDDVLEKLKTEIRVSLDYYRRKFAAKNTKKILLLCSPEFRQNLEAVVKEMGLEVQFMDVTRRIGGIFSYSLSFIKGYCASLSRIIRTDIKINLLAAREKVKIPLERIPLREAESFFKDLRIDFRFVVLGVFICIATFMFGVYRASPLRRELQGIVKSRIGITSANPLSSYEDLTGVQSSYKSRLDVIDDLVKNQLYITEPLAAIPSVMPNGAWLTDFAFSNQSGVATFALNGIVYLGEGDKEFEAVNKLVTGLKSNPGFGKYFKDIRIKSMDRRELDKVTVTYFSIYCSST